MTIIDGIVLAVALACIPAYACRFRQLRFRQHRLGIILFHLMMAWGNVIVVYDYWANKLTIQDVFVVAAALLWIFISYTTWRKGVPPHFLKDAPNLPILVRVINRVY